MSDLRERVAEAIHEGLGGNDWAYTNYGGNELVTEADKLAAAASAAIAIVLEEAARVVTEHYQELSTEHRLLLLNRVAAIRALAKK